MSTEHRLPPLHELIAQLRVDNDLTQEELADRIGVTRNAVTNWESENSDRVPNRKNTRRLEQALGLSRFYLEQEAEWNPEPPDGSEGSNVSTDGFTDETLRKPNRHARRGDRLVPPDPAQSSLAHAA